MKKKMKSLSMVLGVVLFAILFMSQYSTANAATVPKKVRLYYTGTDTINVTLDHYNDSITNLKVNSKKAYVKLTSVDKNMNKMNGTTEEKNQQSIGIYTTAYGTYTISFNIVDEKGKKISSNKIYVYCYDSPFSMTLNGKKTDNWKETTLKNGKIKITSNAKNKIQKLEYGVLKETSTGTKNSHNFSNNCKYEYKTFKNGSKIPFNLKASYNEMETYNKDEYSEYGYYSKWDSFYAYTPIQITYVDQYTKETEVYTGMQITRMYL